MRKTRDAVIAKVQDVFMAAGRNCYARELATCIDHFMQLPALRLAEKAEETAQEGNELAVVRGSLVYELGDKVLVQVIDEETRWIAREHRKVIEVATPEAAGGEW